MKKNIDSGLLILRITIGGLMLFHGVAKFSGIGWMVGMFAGFGLPGFLAYLVYLGEVIAPIMVMIGWKTRIGALLIALTMLVAVFMAHSGDIFSLTEHGGWAIELIMLFVGGSVALWFTGSGKYAVMED